MCANPAVGDKPLMAAPHIHHDRPTVHDILAHLDDMHPGLGYLGTLDDALDEHDQIHEQHDPSETRQHLDQERTEDEMLRHLMDHHGLDPAVFAEPDTDPFAWHEDEHDPEG